MAFPTRSPVDGEELVLDLRPHWIALIMPALATSATVAVMLVLYDTFTRHRSWTVVGVAVAICPARVSGAQAGGG